MPDFLRNLSLAPNANSQTLPPSEDSFIISQDTAIAELETLLGFIKQVGKAQIDYAKSISAALTIGRRIEPGDDMRNTPFSNAIQTMMHSYESILSWLTSSNDRIHNIVMAMLQNALDERKNLRQWYLTRCRLVDTEVGKFRGRTEKYSSEYMKHVTKMVKDGHASPASLDPTSKAAGVRERAFSKLHGLHNRYAIALKEFYCLTSQLETSGIPTFMQELSSLLQYMDQFQHEALTCFTSYTSHASDLKPFYDGICAEVANVDVERANVTQMRKDRAIEQRLPYLRGVTFDPELANCAASLGIMTPPPPNGSIDESALVLVNSDYTTFNLNNTKFTYTTSQQSFGKSVSDRERTIEELNVHRPTHIQIDNAPMRAWEVLRELGFARTEVAYMSAQRDTAASIVDFIESFIRSGGGRPSVPATSHSVPPGPVGGQPNGRTEPTRPPMNIMGPPQLPPLPAHRTLTPGSDVPPLPPHEDRRRPPLPLPVGSGAGPTSPTPPGPDAHGNKQLMPYEWRNKPLEDQEWFHGCLPRNEITPLLANDGDFLVRESSGKRQYVLSVNYGGEHKHFIFVNDHRTDTWKFDGQEYPSIAALLWDYMVSKIPVTSKTRVIISNPVGRSSWELDNDEFQTEKFLGKGHFGEIELCFYRPLNLQCAVKKCKENLGPDEKSKFVDEARRLQKYNHPNIVRFIGIAAKKEPVLIAMEYCPGGALSSYLKKYRSQGLAEDILLMFCLDSAQGMCYLEQQVPVCIHRDLAARNCLLGEHDVVKISDFGMSRDMDEYVMGAGNKAIPVRWTAPEALTHQRYTSKSDVWSYGVLCWEIYMYGQVPYQPSRNNEILSLVSRGERLKKPENCLAQLYELMLRCWNMDAENRPTFAQICQELVRMGAQSAISHG